MGRKRSLQQEPASPNGQMSREIRFRESARCAEKESKPTWVLLFYPVLPVSFCVYANKMKLYDGQDHAAFAGCGGL